MDERARRVGTNEALFRQVNERIEDVNRAFVPLTDVMELVCECGRADCVERIEVSVPDYERVRADARHFLLVPGHEGLEVERVVERGDGWIVVEKRAGDAVEVAEETDPR